MAAERTVLFRYVVDASQTEAANAKTEAGFKKMEQGASAQAAAYGKAAAAAQSHANAEAAAMNKVEQAIRANQAVMRQLQTAIDENRLAAARMNQEMLRLADNGQKTSQAYANLEAKVKSLDAETRVMSAGYSALNHETSQLEGQKKKLSAATEAASNIFNTYTSRINTGRGALAGLDVIIESVARSMGGVSIAWAVGISIGAALISTLLHMGKAKEENIELDEKQMALDVALANSASSLVESQVHQAKVTEDLDALLVSYQKHLEVSREKEEALNRATMSAAEGRQNAKDATLVLSAADETLGAFYAIEALRANEITKGTASLTQERQKSDAELRRDIDSIIQFGIETNKTNAEIIAAARAIYGEGAALNQLESDLNSGRRAVLEFNAAVNALRIGKMDVSATGAGLDKIRSQLNERIGNQVALGMSQKDIFITNSSDLKKYVKDVEEGIKADLAFNRQHVTKKELLALTNAELRKSLDYTAAYARVESDFNTVIEKSGGHHRSGAAAARAYALAENQLTRELKEAEAALVGDNFAAREAKIRASIDAEREALRIKKQLNAESSSQLIQLEHARIEKVSQDKFAAEQRFYDELRQVQIAAIQNDYERERQSLAFKLEKKAEALIREFGLSKETTDKILLYRKATEDEFVRFDLEQEEKRRKIVEAQERQLWNTVAEERLRADERVLREWVRRAKDQQNARTAVGSQIGGNILQPANSAQVTRIIEQMKALGPAFNDVGTDSNKVQAAIQLVADKFGFASRNGHILELQIRALAKLSKGDLLGGLKDSIAAVSKELINAQSLSEVFANSLESAFSRVGEGGETFLRTLAASLIGGITQIVGQVLSQMGTMTIAKGLADIAMGIAISANPLTPGAGAGLIAAGHHEVVVGTALKLLGAAASGLGAAAASAVQGGGKGAGAAGGGGAADTASGGAPARRPKPVNNRIGFPTSGDSANAGIIGSTNRAQTINNYYLLDPETTKKVWSKQFDGHMAEKRVLTADNIDRKELVRRKLKKTWASGVK